MIAMLSARRVHRMAGLGFALVGIAQISYFFAFLPVLGFRIMDLFSPAIGLALLWAAGILAWSPNRNRLRAPLLVVAALRAIDASLILGDPFGGWMIGLAAVLAGAIVQAITARGLAQPGTLPLGLRLGAGLGAVGSAWYAISFIDAGFVLAGIVAAWVATAGWSVVAVAPWVARFGTAPVARSRLG